MPKIEILPDDDFDDFLEKMLEIFWFKDVTLYTPVKLYNNDDFDVVSFEEFCKMIYENASKITAMTSVAIYTSDLTTFETTIHYVAPEEADYSDVRTYFKFELD